MDKLLPELLGRILQLLTTSDLLNCRLVCKSFSQEVDRQLSTVTHIRINEDDWFQTFIPNVLYRNLVSLSFTCKKESFDALFTFLGAKCPQLRVLSAFSESITLDQLVKISKNLVYFQIRSLQRTEETSPEQMKLLFPSLEALVLLNKEFPNAFCTSAWTSQGPGVQVTKFSQSCNFCCTHTDHKWVPQQQIIPGTKWYFALRNFNLTLAKELSEPLVADSLRVLHLEIEGIRFHFQLPNLVYARFVLKSCDQTRDTLNSLKSSTNLKALFLGFHYSQVEPQDIKSLTSSLTQLKVLCFTHQENPLTELVELSLAPKLTYLYMHGFKHIKFTQTRSPSLQFISLGMDSVCPFNFSNLLNCQIFFEHSSSHVMGETLKSLKHSSNLKKLSITFCSSSAINEMRSGPNRALKSLFKSLNKLESFIFFTPDRFPYFSFNLTHYPNLEFFKWTDRQVEEEVDVNLVPFGAPLTSRDTSLPELTCDDFVIYLDKRYQSVTYESTEDTRPREAITLRPFGGHAIKLIVPSRSELKFKHDFECTVTKATFEVPFKLPPFLMQDVIECKIVMKENKGRTLELLLKSLPKFPNLEVFTLITKRASKFTLNQMDQLVSLLDSFEDLKEVRGTVHLCSQSALFDLQSVFSKYPSFNRIRCNWNYCYC